MKHQVIDDRSLELHRVVAEKLRTNPALMDIARANLSRYQSLPGRSFSLLRCDQEWQDILDTKTFDEVLDVVTEESEEGQRLRQSSPFSGILSEEERLRILKKYEPFRV